MSPVWIIVFATVCNFCIIDARRRHSHFRKSLRRRRLHRLVLPVYFRHRIEYDDFSFGSDEESKKDEKEHDFSYEKDEEKGPSHWGEYWHECKGHHQSPVDLRLGTSIFALFKMSFSDETKAFEGIFVNNGHAPTFQLKDKGSILTGVPGRPYDEFVLIQFHFHFGLTNDHGSEHAMNGRFYAGEMHMVHYNCKYKSFDEAVTKPDGLAVVAVFLDETYNYLGNFDKFVETYGSEIITPSNSGILTEFNPFELMPKYRFAFSYTGSLTTPACHESVMWIVMREPMPVHHNTLITFRKFKTKNPKHTIAEFTNDRPLQPINKRTIIRNFTIRLFKASLPREKRRGHY